MELSIGDGEFYLIKGNKKKENKFFYWNGRLEIEYEFLNGKKKE